MNYIPSNDLQNAFSIRKIGVALNIENNPMLTSLDGLSGLETIGTTLGINTNPSLKSLEGLENRLFKFCKYQFFLL